METNGYDWHYIRVLYESGATAYQIAKRPDMPSKQGIEKHAKKHDWVKPTTENRLPIVAEALSVNSSKLTDDLLRVFLGLIAEGSTIEIASAACGISAQTWRAWCKQDPQLKDLVRRARAGKVATWMHSVDRASQTDWKAGQWLLQTAPETRETFAKQAGENKLEVTINIERD